MAKATKQAAKAERNYGLDRATVAELKAAKAYNPYREGSSYWCVIEALATRLGKGMSEAELIAAYQKASDRDALKTFKTRKPRNENGADWKTKIVTNAIVCGRADYGKKLVQLGYRVKIERDAEGNRSFGLYKTGK